MVYPVHYRLLVKGRVQGVGYRAFAQSVAKEIGVKGFVRNMDDGSVEIFCECPDNVMNDFLKKLEQKSESFIGIHVDEIIAEKRDGKRGFKSFDIIFS